VLLGVKPLLLILRGLDEASRKHPGNTVTTFRVSIRNFVTTRCELRNIVALSANAQLTHSAAKGVRMEI